VARGIFAVRWSDSGARELVSELMGTQSGQCPELRGELTSSMKRAPCHEQDSARTNPQSGCFDRAFSHKSKLDSSEEFMGEFRLR
jgi:hypothetical protein